jgi:hypothetical protein
MIGSHNIVVVINCVIRCLMTCVLFLRYISGYSFYAMTDLLCLFFKRAFFFTNNAANRSTSELRGLCTGFLLQDPILIPEVVSFQEGSSILG